MTETYTPPSMGPQRRRPIFFGWYIVAASVATNTIFSAAYFQGFGVLILPIERAFGWDRWVISAAMAMRQVESGIASPFVGLLLDRISPRKMILWSAVLAAIGLIGLGLMNGIVMFFLFFVIVALGASGVSHAVTWPVLIARWFRRKRGLAMGLAVMGPIFGSPIVILNAQIEAAFGWRVVLVGYGLIVLAGISLLSLVARDRPESYGLRPDGDPPEEGASTDPATYKSARRMDTGLSARAALRTKEFWLLTVYLAGTFLVNSAFQVHMIPYFQQDVGLSATWASVVLSIVFVISGVGRIGGGFLMDKLDYRLVLAAVAAMMSLSFVYVTIVDVHSVWMTVPFAVLFGVSFGSTVPMRGTLGSMMFGMRAIGSIIGLLQGGSVVASVVGPLAMGIIFDLNGDYSVAILGLIVISGLMAPVALIMSSPAKLARIASARTDE